MWWAEPVLGLGSSAAAAVAREDLKTSRRVACMGVVNLGDQGTGKRRKPARQQSLANLSGGAVGVGVSGWWWLTASSYQFPVTSCQFGFGGAESYEQRAIGKMLHRDKMKQSPKTSDEFWATYSLRRYWTVLYGHDCECVRAEGPEARCEAGCAANARGYDRGWCAGRSCVPHRCARRLEPIAGGVLPRLLGNTGDVSDCRSPELAGAADVSAALCGDPKRVLGARMGAATGVSGDRATAEIFCSCLSAAAGNLCGWRIDGRRAGDGYAGAEPEAVSRRAGFVWSGGTDVRVVGAPVRVAGGVRFLFSGLAASAGDDAPKLRGIARAAGESSGRVARQSCRGHRTARADRPPHGCGSGARHGLLHVRHCGHATARGRQSFRQSELYLHRHQSGDDGERLRAERRRAALCGGAQGARVPDAPLHAERASGASDAGAAYGLRSSDSGDDAVALRAPGGDGGRRREPCAAVCSSRRTLHV